MKTKISRISQRTVAMVLVLLLIFSALITANAADVSKKATGSGWTTNSLNFRGKINTNKFGATTGGDNDNWNSIAMVSGGNNNNYYYMNAIVEGNKKVTFKFTDQWTQWLGGGTRAAGTYTGGSYVYYTGMSTSGGNDYFTTPSAADYYVCAIQCWTNYSNDWKCRIDMFPLSSTKLHFYKASGYNKVYSFSTTTKGANSPTATSVSSTNTLTDTVHFNNAWNSETAGTSETLTVSDFGTTYDKSWYCLDKFYYGSLASKLTTNTAIIHSSSAQGVEKTLNISDLDLGELWVYDNGTNFVVSDRSALRDEFDSATRDYSTAYNGGTNPGFTSTTYSAFKTAYQNAASTYTAYASTTANCDDAISDLQDAYDDLAVDVTWVGATGNIYTDTCTIGNTPSYDSATHGTPTKASTAQYSYTFSSWSPAPAAVTASGGAQTMTAQFNSSTRSYTIKKDETGGEGTVTIGSTEVTTSNKSVNYGSYTLTVNAPSGYNVSEITGVTGTWSGLNTETATLTGYTHSSNVTLSITYEAAGSCGLSLNKTGKQTMDVDGTMSVTITPNAFHDSGTISVSSSASAFVGVSAISNNSFTVTAKKPTSSDVTITVSCTEGGTASFTVAVSEPTFTIGAKTIYVSSSAVDGGSINDGDVTPTSIAYTSSNTTYITVGASNGKLTAVKVPSDSDQTSTITATATYANGYSKSTTYTATLKKPTLTASSTSASGYVGDTATGSCSGTNPALSSDTVSSYSWTSNDSDVVGITNGSTATPSFSFKKAGSATITLTVTYKNTSLTKTATTSITVNPPSVAFSSHTTVALNVNASNTNSASGINPTGGTLTYSGTNEYISVDSGTGAVTGLKPTSDPQTVTATYTVTSGGQSTVVTDTYTVTVNDPTINASDFNVAKGDRKTLSATTSNPAGLTIAYSLKAAVTGVTVEDDYIDVANDCSASSATVVVSAKNSAGTVVKTKEITATIEDPELVVKFDGTTVNESDVKYITAGDSETLDISDTNFSGTLYFKSSNTSVATVGKTTGTITAVAKGTTTIRVTNWDPDTRAVGDQSLTFTVNVAEADNSQFITLATSWSSAYIYYWGSSPANANKHLQMTKVGTDNEGRNVYAINVGTDTFSKINAIIFESNNNWADQTNDITGQQSNSAEKNKLKNTSGTKFNSFYIDGSTNNKNDAGGYNTTITIPQITTPSTLEVAVDDTETITPTVVNNVTPAATLFVSDDTDTATVGASTGVVTGVDAGSANVTAYAFAPKPSAEWTSWITDSTTKNIIAGSATTSVSVTDTPRTINFSNTLKTTSGGTYDAAGANAAGTVTASYTTGGSGSGSGSGGGSAPGGDTTYYLHIGKQNAFCTNTAIAFTWDATNSVYYASYTASDINADIPFVINTTSGALSDSDKQSSNQAVHSMNNSTYNPDGLSFNYFYYATYNGFDCFKFGVNSSRTLYFTFASAGSDLIVRSSTNYTPGSGSGGGSGSGSSSPTAITDGDTVPNGSDVTFTVDSVTAGYRFVGWEENGTVVETATTYTKSGVRANYTVHARFEKGINVTFKDYDDTVLQSSAFYFTDGTDRPAAPDDPTRTDFTFTGWSADSGVNTYAKADIPYASGTADIIYTAQYRAVVYSATGRILVSNNGTSYTDVSTYDNSHKISVSTADNGATFTIKNTDNSDISDPTSMSAPKNVKLVATAVSGYELVGIYRVRSDMSEEEVSCSTSADNSTKTCSSYSFTTENEPGYNFVAKFKKIHYITLYNTYEEDAGNNFKFVSPPPRQVKVGTGAGAITYTYASGTAEQRGEDIIATAVGTSGTYYEGNRIPVPAGTEVKLTYSALASSDAISGVFFNNGIRYTHEYEPDNLYVNRVKQAEPGSADYESHEEDGWDSGDDNFGTSVNPYTYLSATTLYADASFYSGATATTISGQTYTAAVNNTDHTVTWTAVDDYLNIDLELATKYRIIINNDEWNGIEVTNSTYNAEGYYFPGERINGDTGIEVSLDTSDSSKHFSFTDVNTIQKKTGDNNYETVTDVELVKSDGKYYIRGTDADNKDMPAYDIYVGIGVKEEYKMYLDNFVVADNIASRKALTETYSKTNSSAPYGDRIGTITAVTSDDVHIETDCPDSAYSYAQISANPSQNTHWVQNGSNWNPKYKGTNTTGTAVEAGQTVTYTFTFNTYDSTDYANYYSFVGWFEGTISNGVITPDYTKKLSGKTTFTYTPKKDTVVVAAGTRDIYLGGNFTNGGAYTTTAGQQTWSTNRIQMEFDPTYVKPGESDKKGRYFYKFDTVTANTEYQFRCYDTVSGSDSADLSVWQTWSGADYADDNDDIFYGRHKYDNSTNSHGQFVYKNNTNNWSLIDNKASDHDSTKNHQALGYAAPVTVYFYAYDGGIGVESEYQWSKAYVSAGRGIDCTNYDDVIGSGGATPSYNTPTVSVANKTVNDKDVDGTTTPVTYGEESVYKCTVKEKDGQITVSACPGVTDLELDAFVVYNIDTKESEAVKHSSTTGTGAATAYVAEITVPQNSSVYIVPVYKFTDAYITDTGLKAHTVYVRTDDIDKDVWGGLVAMYSWGSKTDSGGWPGQLLIPSDDGKSFYGQLAFGAGDLRGITFNNYCKIYGGAQKTFLGTYGSDVSTKAYSANSTHVYQTYDYREPISIIENIDDKIYEDEDMDLTFALKSGDMTAAPTINSAGSGAYNRASTWEYLTDRSGKKRVDLNGDALATNSTETYRIVAYYTNAYASSGSYNFADGTRTGTGYSGSYSINWTVYDATGASTGVSGVLSAAYTDVFKTEGMTYIAQKLDDAGYPVSGKAVKIAYENPGTWSETIRYSGQWYADGVNSLIEAKTRVGIYSDGAWLPSDTNAPGYGTATIACPTMNAGKGENLVQEFSSGNSLAKVIKSRGTNGEVQFTVDSTDNFLGWYREDGEGGFEPVGSNYKNQTITPSFNDDITYYAFYSASASYVFEYTSRDGSMKQYTAKGSDLTDAELASGGTLNASARAADITSKLSGISNIKVFNRTFTYDISNADTSKPYVIKYSDPGTENTYNVDVYDASKSKIGTVSSTFGNPIDLYRTALTGKPANTNIDLVSGGNVFIGWKKYDTTKSEAVGDYLSTQPNFGYSVTEHTSIIACYGSESDKETARADLWRAYIDKNVITQELTSETTGKLYNDSIIAFRNGVGTNTPLPLDGTKECGIVILAQTNSASEEEQTQFATRGQSSLLGYANNFRQTGTTSGKMNSKYGEAYAFCIKAESLSELNRIDLCQILDYAKFNGGKYKVMSYYYDASVNSTGGYKCSEVVNGTYTVS